ncbi:MAG: AraC family transcriptional regulator [Oleiphilaceae bacterium]|nr:AraC family transcriptional regulator [Oleiphilaceae bacterium]
MDHTNPTLEIRSYDDEARTHHHDHHQLVLPVAGQLALTIHHTEGRVSEEQAAVIPAGFDHGFAADNPNRFLVADVPAALAPALERLPLFIPLDRSLAHYIAFLNQQLAQGVGGRNTERQMLMLLIQLFQERHQESLGMDRRIALATAYLDEHFQQPASLAGLAGVAHLSVRQLSELFRQQVGMTPQQYLTEKRMQRAWQLLETSPLSIQAIAEQVGYTSLAAFSDRFRRHFGQSPRYFRQSGK